MSRIRCSSPTRPPCGGPDASEPEPVIGIGLPKALHFESSEFLKAPLPPEGPACAGHLLLQVLPSASTAPNTCGGSDPLLQGGCQQANLLTRGRSLDTHTKGLGCRRKCFFPGSRRGKSETQSIRRFGFFLRVVSRWRTAGHRPICANPSKATFECVENRETCVSKCPTHTKEHACLPIAAGDFASRGRLSAATPYRLWGTLGHWRTVDSSTEGGRHP